MHTTQLNRIQKKLKLAQEKDKDLKVFGASSHQYKVEKPLTEKEVQAFEEKYQVQLPDSYRSFILTIGNSGIHRSNAFVGSSMAGPFYGIYPLGHNISELIYEHIEDHLKQPCVLYPKMKSEDWDALTKALQDDTIDDDTYEKAMAKIYAGMLPLGTQGCSYLHALVLNGKHKGKVVNCNSEHFDSPPIFTFEDHFLDWYERWLDEIISGQLIDNNSSFGFYKSGTATSLFAALKHSKDTSERYDILDGIIHLNQITKEHADDLVNLIKENNCIPKNKHLIVLILTKFYLKLAIPILMQELQGNAEQYLNACQAIHWYIKEEEKKTIFVDTLLLRLPEIESPEALRFTLYTLEAVKADYCDVLVPFAKNKNPSLRKTMYYHLGKSNKAQKYDAIFKAALREENRNNITTVLQAIPLSLDYVPYMNEVLHRFSSDYFVLANIARMLSKLEDDTLFTTSVKDVYRQFFTQKKDTQYYLRNLINQFKNIGKPMLDLVAEAKNHPDIDVREAAEKTYNEMV